MFICVHTDWQFGICRVQVLLFVSLGTFHYLDMNTVVSIVTFIVLVQFIDVVSFFMHAQNKTSCFSLFKPLFGDWWLHVVRKFPAFYWICKLIFVFLRVPSISLHPVPLRSSLILLLQLCLVFWSCVFCLSFPTKIFQISFYIVSSVCAICLLHFLVLDVIIIVMLGEEYKLWISIKPRFLSILLFPPPPQIQIFSSTLCFKTSAKYVLLCEWETKFYT